jgi:hypothetical protein
MFRAVVVCFEMKGSDVELEASKGHEAAVDFSCGRVLTFSCGEEY